ncbi:hypothetical protein [uncultured Mediterranean phage uvMED]|nr:hypothetical protein [uncultured Mediterranean phage uvMED]
MAVLLFVIYIDKMALGNSNNNVKRFKHITKIRTIIKKFTDELWDFKNINWNSLNSNWDE